MEQLQKGKKITVVHVDDLERALEEDNIPAPVSASVSAPVPAAKVTTQTPADTEVPKKTGATVSTADDFYINRNNALEGYLGEASVVIIPDGVTEIAEDAFFANKNITSVIIPEGVREIGDGAFWLCSNLEEVVLPSTITKLGENAFNSTAISTIIIPEDCKEIGPDCFTSCKQLVDIYIPAYVCDIKTDAFYTFNKDTVIHTVRGSSAEAYAEENSVTFDYKSVPSGVAKNTPANQTASTTKTVPVNKTPAVKSVFADDFIIESGNVLTGYTGISMDVVVPDGIAEIADDAFLGKDIESIVIPEGVEVIGSNAFLSCKALTEVVLPSTITKIDNSAFMACPSLESIVIPDGCKEIGADCFTNCSSLKDIYVPASVTTIGEDAFCTFYDDMVIHTERGCEADRHAQENSYNVDYEAAPYTTINDDLSEQIYETEYSELTPEQIEALGEARTILSDLGQSVADSEGAMEKYSKHLEWKEKYEKEDEERKARAKVEALAAGKSEKDIVNMYIILTNEKKIGQLHRSAEDFYDTYEDDFNALSKEEILQLRKDMLDEMEDDDLCSYYAESFRHRSLEERFTVSTLNLSNVNDEPHFGIKAKWAIDNSAEWYVDSERAEVERLMEAKVAKNRADMDEQLDGIDSNWKKFDTAKSSLKIVINEKTEENSTIEAPYTFCKMIIGDTVVLVRLATSGYISLATTVMDTMPWYWGVTVRDIWEAAYNNPVDDKREYATDGNQIANQAMNQIRAKYTAMTTNTAEPVTRQTVTSSSQNATSFVSATAASSDTATENASSQNNKRGFFGKFADKFNRK